MNTIASQTCQHLHLRKIESAGNEPPLCQCEEKLCGMLFHFPKEFEIKVVYGTETEAHQ